MQSTNVMKVMPFIYISQNEDHRVRFTNCYGGMNINNTVTLLV